MLEIPQRNPFAPRTAPKSIWTPQLFEDVRRMWIDNKMTCGQIAAEMAHRGVFLTRNAIIGKIHREGLGGTHPRFKPPGRSIARAPREPKSDPAIVHRIVRKRRERPRDVRLAALAIAATEPVFHCDGFVGVSFDELTSRTQCRWPQGGDEISKIHEMRFCGQMVFEGTSYCAGHFYRSLAPSVRRDKESAV